jgi:eukaryotic-like serine/threonine-protein kinase
MGGATQPRRLTLEGRNRFPVWSADSRRVLFQSDRDGGLGLYWQGVDAGAAERLTTPDAATAHVPDSWSPDGDRFTFSIIRGTSASLWTFSMRERQAVRFGNAQSTTPFNSEFSPDGHWLAYTLRDGSTANIFVEPFPATGDRYQITTFNGHHPVWVPGTNTLSYRVGAGDQTLVDINSRSGLSWSNPRLAVKGELPTVVGMRSFDITRDGSAFLAVAPVSSNEGVTNELGVTSVQEIRIVQNWTEELKRLVPAK